MNEKSDSGRKIKKVSVSDLQQSFFDMIVLLVLGVEEILEQEIKSKGEDNSTLSEVLNIFKWTTFHVKILRDDMNFYSRDVLEMNIEKAKENLLYLENIKNNNLKKNKEGK